MLLIAVALMLGPDTTAQNPVGSVVAGAHSQRVSR